MKTLQIPRIAPKDRALTSLDEQELTFIYPLFSELVEKKLLHYTLKGVRRVRPATKEDARSGLQGAKAKLDFLLIYMKFNMDQRLTGHFYGMSQSKVSEWVSFLVPVLERTLYKKGFTAVYGDTYFHQHPDNECLSGDVTERPLGRSTCHKTQKDHYSGKAKGHRLKNFAICDEYAYIHFLSPSYPGSVHDKRIWDDMGIETNGPNLLLDLGFHGADKDRVDIICPFKKPRNGELTKVQKQLNKAISSVRIRIEHAFSGVKRMAIIGHKIRLKGYDKREAIMRIAVALHNLRTVMRHPLLKRS